MPKYYVKSGDIRFIIDTTDYITAILASLRRYKGKGFAAGPKICVSETGFQDHAKWSCYDTQEFFKQI